MNQSPPAALSTPDLSDPVELPPDDAIFRELFEGAPIGMALLALDERFLRVNASFCTMVGYSNEELRQRTAEDITFADDIETGRQLAQSLVQGTAASQATNVTSTRTAKFFGSAAREHHSDEQGEPQHFLLMVEDISERKASEAALEKTGAICKRPSMRTS